eukprot:3242486-Pleurochrysis_carterae.AAC.1
MKGVDGEHAHSGARTAAHARLQRACAIVRTSARTKKREHARAPPVTTDLTTGDARTGVPNARARRVPAQRRHHVAPRAHALGGRMMPRTPGEGDRTHG